MVPRFFAIFFSRNRWDSDVLQASMRSLTCLVRLIERTCSPSEVNPAYNREHHLLHPKIQSSRIPRERKCPFWFMISASTTGRIQALS